MKRTITTLLALLLLLSLLAACSTSTDTQTPAATTDTPAADTSDATEPPEDTAPEADTTETTGTPPASDDTDDSWLPLVDEPATLSMWTAYTSQVDPNLAPGDTAIYQQVEEMTNVIVEYTTVSSDAGTEQFGLMMVSGDFCDMITHDHSAIRSDWPGGIASCLEQDILMDVSEYITGGYAPHYQALRESDPMIHRDTMLDDGSIPSFHRIMTTNQVAWVGLMLASDLVEREGFDLNELVTLDDWHEMLLAFAAAEDIRVPFELTNTGLDAQMLTTFDIPTGDGFQSWFRKDKNGGIEFSYTTQDYYDYLTTLKQWYEEGILENQWYGTSAAYCFDLGAVAEGDIACFRALGSQIDVLNSQSDRVYVAVPSPLREGATQRNVVQCSGCFSRVESREVAISSSCSNPQLACQWLDFFYSDEAFLLCNYGIEGVTYEMVEGEPKYTEYILNNPDGLSWENIMRTYGGKAVSVFLYKWDAQVSDQSAAMQQAYSRDGFDRYYDASEDLYTIPTLSMTPEESEIYSTTFSDIQTYVQEMVIKFLTGEQELSEASYAAYCANIEQMRIQDCVDVLSAAYTRYQQR